MYLKKSGVPKEEEKKKIESKILCNFSSINLGFIGLSFFCRLDDNLYRYMFATCQQLLYPSVGIINTRISLLWHVCLNAIFPSHRIYIQQSTSIDEIG